MNDGPSWPRAGAVVFAKPAANDRPHSRSHQKHVSQKGIMSPGMEIEMIKILLVSLAFILFGSGVWANVSGGSLSQNRGAWVSHIGR
jgi:hypothetical protein